ncbi:capsule assembly Wzi family protein [Flavisolibacter ginsenosidimutans]|uniref:Capsule assembly Wzi family protein n=1 Tax=Flavisolibacter ginsenosidimutans TaxID=661481 RepID=A0A5B8UKV3_9BACT|nr:capsule assembly Wzi family protein [Flavisolibacter ginsenosidimutans]QEC57321.1 capsule assembly Wzi family protein [Flavisolibacter ginsenosidimutans]
MKNTRRSFFASLLIFFSIAGVAQTLPAGTPFLEESWRRAQVEGKADSNVSFTVRPLTAGATLPYDSLYQTPTSVFFQRGKTLVRLLPLSLTQQFNSHHPYGWNDGSMIPAAGYQAQFSVGLFARFGPFSVQLRPEFVYAQNASFATFPSQHNDSIWRSYYYTVLNKIDAPERFGNGTYTKLFAGQSSIRLNVKKLSLGLSTENLWWGPGIRNSLLMTNNAPGFPHVTVNTTAPLLSPIGSFEGQLISGFLKSSGILPPDTSRTFNGQKLYTEKPQGDRYANGMILTWQPKWTKGLFLGFSRMFYLYRADVQHSFNGYLPVIGHLFKGSGNVAETEDARKRDQIISFFFRLLLPKEFAEVYGEFGRNDHSEDSRDLAMEPEHSRAYVIGFRKLFATGKKGAKLELMAEQTNLQIPSTIMLRAQESWYAHYQVRDGYTNLGQVVGAGIGPGGNSQTIGLSWVKDLNKTGLLLERIIHNNDFYYDAFVPTRNNLQHWVDLSIGASKSWQKKNFLYKAGLTWTRSLNYEWQYREDRSNLQARLSVLYRF